MLSRRFFAMRQLSMLRWIDYASHAFHACRHFRRATLRYARYLFSADAAASIVFDIAY
jgi:hypothetical protein